LPRGELLSAFGRRQTEAAPRVIERFVASARRAASETVKNVDPTVAKRKVLTGKKGRYFTATSRNA
jgi:hypothetical protein